MWMINSRLLKRFPVSGIHNVIPALTSVIPAQAGIQFFFNALDPRFRGGDDSI